MTKTPAGG